MILTEALNSGLNFYIAKLLYNHN